MCAKTTKVTDQIKNNSNPTGLTRDGIYGLRDLAESLSKVINSPQFGCFSFPLLFIRKHRKSVSTNRKCTKKANKSIVNILKVC